MARHHDKNNKSQELKSKVDKTEDSLSHTRRLSRFSLVVSIATLILVLLLQMCSSPSNQATIDPQKCAPGLSAYQLWLNVGNSGSEQDFLDSLIGVPGADGYVGSDGFSGEDGKSAYQIWLDAGNSGSPEDFLDSLEGLDGNQGASGTDGLSAYDLWLGQGYVGTEQDFLNFLAGDPGAPGQPGAQGQPGASGSPGPSGSPGQPGEQGSKGEPGATGEPGPTGPAGAAGLSAYEIWLSQPENSGKTEQEFLASLVGPEGDPGICTPGDVGPTGPAGPQGEPGTSGFGASGAWYDLTDQEYGSGSGARAMTFNRTDYENGVSINSGSQITFEAAGTYNVQFSAQLSYPGGGKDEFVNIWLAKNGTTVPNTNTRMLVPGGNDGYVVAAWNFFVEVGAGDYVELLWNATDPLVQILHENDSGGSGTYQPGIPSVILTVNQVAG